MSVIKCQKFGCFGGRRRAVSGARPSRLTSLTCARDREPAPRPVLPSPEVRPRARREVAPPAGLHVLPSPTHFKYRTYGRVNKIHLNRAYPGLRMPVPDRCPPLTPTAAGRAAPGVGEGPHPFPSSHSESHHTGPSNYWASCNYQKHIP